MDDLKHLKQVIKELDEELQSMSVLDYDDRVLITAQRNAKAREYNSKKQFWQKRIERIF